MLAFLIATLAKLASRTAPLPWVDAASRFSMRLRTKKPTMNLDCKRTRKVDCESVGNWLRALLLTEPRARNASA